MIRTDEALSPREREQLDHDILMFDKQAEHTQKVKSMERDTKMAEIQLRLDAAKATRESQERIRDKELALAKLEARWLSWLRIPITIVKLPLYLVLGVAVCIALARKSEVPDRLYLLLK